MPPRMQFGMLRTQPPNLPKIPRSRSQKAQAQPAWREATLVKAMTPESGTEVVLVRSACRQ